MRRTPVGVAAGLAAFAATAALAVTHTGHSGSALPRRSLALGALGPEGVPVPSGSALAPPQRLRDGQRIDGITCQVGEQLAFHIHAHVRIVVRGRSRQVPAGIGIAPPYEVAQTQAGPFVAGASCFMWLHTHAADGIVHIESPVEREYTLGEFFDVWGQQLGRDRVGPAQGRVTAFLNGKIFSGDPRRIPLLAHNQIELEVGRPIVAPERITFPSGL
jgi:hypothetical protein